MKRSSEERSPMPARVIPLPLGILSHAEPAALPSAMLASDERSLCERALCGDISAWNVLVQKHNHRVVVSLLARGVRIDRAKDIAQDAWIRLIEQQREGRLSHLQLPGLAVAQAGFMALEAARRMKRTEPLEGAPEELPDPSADAEAQLISEERLARAEKILSRCSPSAKSVFHLVYGGEGLDHAEVAERLGLSLQRVRQIVCEVRKLLRAAVEGSPST